ncbi:ATP-binding protein [Streptomyces sp. 4N509B]|uniref:ATP-binding protein n=1 Tax=Streptomyces sp. 4N509B TaxID=3457413 RepID=UPI003FD0FB24
MSLAAHVPPPIPAHDAPGRAGDRPERPGRAPDPTREPWVGEVRLVSRPESAGVARRLTRHQLQSRWLLGPKLADDAVLLVSELVGNAVAHAGAHVFGLRIRRRRGWVRVEVRDPSRALPCRLPVGETDVSGRGLWLVEQLADRWGVDLLPDGKTTWFELRLAKER